MKIAVRKSDGYILNGFMIYCEVPHCGEYEEYKPLFEGEDYSEYEVSYLPEYDIKEMTLVDFYYQNGIFSVKYTPNKVCINKEITRLKAELSGSDYKIIKSYEASLLDIGQEYDLNEVHAARQAIRDKINELENYIK